MEKKQNILNYDYIHMEHNVKDITYIQKNTSPKIRLYINEGQKNSICKQIHKHIHNHTNQYGLKMNSDNTTDR